MLKNNIASVYSLIHSRIFNLNGSQTKLPLYNYFLMMSILVQKQHL